MLIKTPEQRLGGSLADVEEIKQHPYFASIDWTALERKEVNTSSLLPPPSLHTHTCTPPQVTPPFDPKVESSFDLRNIDPEFVKEPIPGSAFMNSIRVLPFIAVLLDPPSPPPSQERHMNVKVSDAFDGFTYAGGV